MLRGGERWNSDQRNESIHPQDLLLKRPKQQQQQGEWKEGKRGEGVVGLPGSLRGSVGGGERMGGGEGGGGREGGREGTTFFSLTPVNNLKEGESILHHPPIDPESSLHPSPIQMISQHGS